MSTTPKAPNPTPDTTYMTRFCRELIPGVLREVCAVEAAQSKAIGEDMLARAHDFAALGRTSQHILSAPFVEEVVGYKPLDASLALKAAVTVVVRNSLLEDAHAHGSLNEGGIEAITVQATGPLSHLLAAKRQEAAQASVAANQFSSLADTYPRAWACLSALHDTLSLFQPGAEGSEAGSRVGWAGVS